VDETWVKVGSQEAWLWLAFEPYGRWFLGFRLSRTRNILTAELFLQTLIDRYGRHPVYTDEGDWYPDACRSLELEHRIYDAVRGNLMERFVQYVKDRTEVFDDYFPCRREHCRFEHVEGWLRYYQLFFNLFRRRGAMERSPILQLAALIKGGKDPP
jgi:putative transposase